ncbi:MAG: hypothetical protein OCD01_11980 [Fibrobacterales bacterium]
MSIGYDREVLNRVMSDPAYHYDMHFKDFARLYKNYSEDQFDTGRAIMGYGGQPAAPQAAPELSTEEMLAGVDGTADIPSSGSSGGDDAGEELLEQADIDALLAQMQ